MPKMIVITGGPCAGKTSALTELRRRFCSDVEFVPEAATDLILDGIAPWTCDSWLEFQTHVMQLQLKREAAAVSGAYTLVICDRGVCDSRAYLTEDEYEQALAANGLTCETALARYDAVFHLESAAKGDPAAYTQANNKARFENVEEAAEADDRIAAAWADHPNLMRIPYNPDFNAKMDTLAHAIEQLRLEPEA